MAAKMKVARLESDLEKCRLEGNWAKAVDLARQLSSGKSTGLEALVILVLGESKLERYLNENPPTEENISKARQELQEAQQQLQDSLKADPKPELRLEASLLLAKVHYTMGDYKGAYAKLEEVGIETLNLDNVSNRRLKIIGESFAIKGLCMEKLPAASTSKFKVKEHEEEIIRCFEKAGDISLVQMQDLQDRGKGTPTSVSLQAAGLWTLSETDSGGLGPVVETAIQRSPIYYIRNGQLTRGIGRFRELLQAVETRAVQGLRQILARQLAEVLLRGVCESSYIPVSLASTQSPPAHGSRALTPKKYSGENLFVPKDQNEETLLLLLISESMATREAILNRSPEHTEIRKQTFHNTTAVYDLLTILLVRRAQYNMLTETFERAMKFSFDEFHIWYQFALSLICAEKYARALLVLKECMKISPKNVPVYMQAAVVCYEHLHQLDEGISYAKTVVDLNIPSPQLARSCILLGIGFALKADEARIKTSRQEYQRKALDMFRRAQSLDTNDYLAAYHLALQLSILRQIPEALKQVRRSLQLRSDHCHSLHLLALLLSANKQYEDALNLMEATCNEYPNNFSLLLTRCRLEEVVYGTDEALYTCKCMLQLWKELYEHSLEKHVEVLPGRKSLPHLTQQAQQSPKSIRRDFKDSRLSFRDSREFVKNARDSFRESHKESMRDSREFSHDSFDYSGEVLSDPRVESLRHGEQRGTGLIDRVTADTRSLVQLHLTDLSDRDSGSVRAESIAASRVEQALSEVASSMNSIQPRQGPSQTWALQAQIWLQLGELYLSLDRLEEAQACIAEAGAIFPVSYMVSYMKGRLQQQKGELYEAKQCFETSISINPAHVKSLQHLGLVLHQLGNNHLAEKVLRDAVNADPTSSQSWEYLGTTLQAIGEFEAASECLVTAVELEGTSPITPFTVIPRTFQ